MAINGVGFDSKETVQAFIDKIKSQRSELVPSVSYYQKGTMTKSLPQAGQVSFTITFSTAMPDTDYVFAYTVDGNYSSRCIVEITKSKTGVTGTIKCLEGQTVGADSITYNMNWQAFKLMTDESRALDEQAIAQNTSDISDLQDDVESIQAVIPETASASNQLVTESKISKTEKTLSIGGSASAIVKIDVSVPFLDSDYGKFTEIDFQVRSDNIRFFISANDGAYLVTAQQNYKSSGWLTGLNYLVNGSKNISLYVSILNYPANVGAKLVFNGLDGAEITGMSKVSVLPSGYAPMKQSPVIYTSDLTSTVTSGSTAPVTSGGVASETARLQEEVAYANMEASTAKSEIGDITALETTDQTDLVSAINELVHRINAL